MEEALYRAYVKILEEELVPAMGCTEPIAVAYAAALARETLGETPQSVDVRVSANIIKNVKSVVVPHTGGLRGIAAAVAAGVVAGDAGKELEVLSAVTEEHVAAMANYLRDTTIAISPSQSGYIFDIQIRVKARDHAAFIQIAGSHTNVIRVEKDGTALRSLEYAEGGQPEQTDRSLLNVEKIIEFADCVDIEDVKAVLDRQIAYNTAIAEEGFRGNWGANIGSVLLKAYGDGVANRAKAAAAAGSDARMSGCELPVVINSGSGNQGLTVSLPVIEYAQQLGADQETLYRALLISNLLSIHIKRHIGVLSAFCGAVSAAAGAGAAITFLYSGTYDQICMTIVNTLANVGGIVCDGAKSSCAAKISASLDAAIVGHHMAMAGRVFPAGEGLVKDGIEATIQSIGRMAREGMRDTDIEILRIMISC